MSSFHLSYQAIREIIGRIKDNNGDKILDTTTTMTGAVVTVVMPPGKSCDGLELRGTGQETTKTVEKNNNGKQLERTNFLLEQIAQIDP